MSLHVEDKLTCHLPCGRAAVRALLRRNIENAAGRTGGCVCGIFECGATRSARRGETSKIAVAKAQLFSVLACCFLCQPVAGVLARESGTGSNSPFDVVSNLIGSRCPSGNHVFHTDEYRPRGSEWRGLEPTGFWILLKRSKYFRIPARFCGPLAVVVKQMR